MPKPKPNPARLARLFQQLRSDAARLFFTFGAQVPPDQLIRRLRRNATTLGARLLRLLPENRRSVEPNEVFGTYTYEHFILNLRRVLEDCQFMLAEGRAMEPEAWAKFYGRRLGNRGRKLLMLSQLELIDWDAMNRIIARESRYLEERARASGELEPSATPPVVAIDDPQAQLAAKDRTRSGFILNVGPDRVVFDCTAKIEKRVPRSSSMERVLPMTTKSARE